MQLVAEWYKVARLWLVLDRAAAQPRSLAEVTLLAIQGGVDCVVFRHKASPFEDVLSEALAVRACCREHGRPFILSHELAYIGQLQPDAVQLGTASAPATLEPLRQIYQDVPVWGASTHSIAEALQRAGEGYDYAFIGPVFATTSKLGMGEPLGEPTLVAARAIETTVPLIWIGGVTQARLAQTPELRTRRVAVLSAIAGCEDPYEAAQQLRQELAK